MIISRRSLLVGSAAAAMSGVRIPKANAADPIVVGAWGGDYGSILQRNVDFTIMKAKGIEISQDIGSVDARRTKIIAEKTSRRGSLDVACVGDADTYQLAELGLLDQVNEQSVPRLSQMLPAFKSQYAVSHIYSALVVLYNPNKITTPPTSYAALYDPKYKGRVGFSDLIYTYNMATANLAAGAPMNDFTTAKKTLLDVKAAGVKIYPSNEALAAALKAEDIWITTMWLARAYMWKKAGIPVEAAYPDEGAVPILFQGVVPKNARNKPTAFAYVNAMLEPSAQIGFAQEMGYVPTVQDTKLPDDLAKLISLTDAQQAKLRPLDYAYMHNERSALADFWNKDFKS